LRTSAKGKIEQTTIKAREKKTKNEKSNKRFFKKNVMAIWVAIGLNLFKI